MNEILGTYLVLSTVASFLFGVWQESFEASLFMFVLLLIVAGIADAIERAIKGINK